MKKILCTILIAVMLCSCTSRIETSSDKASSMFIEVERIHTWRIVYHRDTKVMYAVSASTYNYGTFTLLVNADGTPMVYGMGD